MRAIILCAAALLMSGCATGARVEPTVTYANPARYFLVIVQGLFLKGMPAANVFHQLWPLVLIALVTLSASAWLFRSRME